MPRKVKYGVDHDEEEYDIYDEYDYDNDYDYQYESGIEENG